VHPPDKIPGGAYVITDFLDTVLFETFNTNDLNSTKNCSRLKQKNMIYMCI